MRRVEVVLSLVLLGSVAVSGCASSQPQPDVALSVADGDLELVVSADLARELLADALETDLECDGDLDPSLTAFLGRLDRSARSRAALRTDDSRLTGTRRGGRLELEARRADGSRFEARLPWAVAECLLGRDTSLDEALGRGPLEVVVTTADGRRLSARMD